MMTLKQAKIGDTVTVVKLHGEGAVKRRIMDMGITKGVSVHVRKVASLGESGFFAPYLYKNPLDFIEKITHGFSPLL